MLSLQCCHSIYDAFPFLVSFPAFLQEGNEHLQHILVSVFFTTAIVLKLSIIWMGINRVLIIQALFFKTISIYDITSVLFYLLFIFYYLIKNFIS